MNRSEIIEAAIDAIASELSATIAQRERALVATLEYAASDVDEATARELARHFVEQAIETSMPAPTEEDVRAETESYEVRLAKAGRRAAIRRRVGGWR